MTVAAIIGGSGFVGRRLVARAASMGWRLRVGCRHPETVGHVRVSGAVGQVEPMYCDVRSASSLQSILDGCDVAVNLVGILHERGSQRFSSVHVDGAESVARLCRDHGVRELVHISAIGASPDSESRYASSKGEGEEAVRSAFPAATVLRPSIIFGEGDRFFTRFGEMTKFSPVLPIVGASTRFQPVYVDDVCQAVIAVATASPKERLYEIGGPTTYTFRRLMELLLSRLGVSRPIVSIPFPLAQTLGRFAQLLPNPPLTYDQTLMLMRDNVVSPDASGLDQLGISSTPVESVIDQCVSHLRKEGQYASIREEMRVAAE